MYNDQVRYMQVVIQQLGSPVPWSCAVLVSEDGFGLLGDRLTVHVREAFRFGSNTAMTTLTRHGEDSHPLQWEFSPAKMHKCENFHPPQWELDFRWKKTTSFSPPLAGFTIWLS